MRVLLLVLMVLCLSIPAVAEEYKAPAGLKADIILSDLGGDVFGNDPYGTVGFEVSTDVRNENASIYFKVTLDLRSKE